MRKGTTEVFGTMPPWYGPLRKPAIKAFLRHPSRYGEDAVLFYLARWCEKSPRRKNPGQASQPPNLHSFTQKELAGVADEIASNLAADGEQVEHFFALDRIEYDKLRGELLATARRYTRWNTEDYADDAMQKVAEIVLTGTRPLCTGCKLSRRRQKRLECWGCERKLGVDGPNNEYVFEAPFLPWIRTVARHLVFDDMRRRSLWMRWRRDLMLVDEERYLRSFYDNEARIEMAEIILEEMLKKIERLPKRQKSVMILSLCRADVNDLLHERLHLLAPGLLGEVINHKRFASDEEIAEHLGTTARNVASTRCAARKKLAGRNPLRREALNVVLPHRSYIYPVKGTSG